MKSPRLSNEQLNNSHRNKKQNPRLVHLDTLSEEKDGPTSDNNRYSSKMKKDLNNFVMNTPKGNLQVLKGVLRKDKFLRYKNIDPENKKIKVSFNKDNQNLESIEYTDTFDKTVKENKPIKKDSNHFADYIQKAENKFKMESFNKHINLINKGLQKSKNVLIYQRKKFIDNIKSSKREKSNLPNDIHRFLKEEKINTMADNELRDSQNNLPEKKGPSNKRLTMLKASFKAQEDSIDTASVDIERIKAPKGFHRYRKSNEIPVNIMKIDHDIPKDDSYKTPPAPMYKEHEFCNVFKIINFLDQDIGLNKQRLAIREKMKLMRLKAAEPHIEKYNDEKAFLGNYEILEELGEGSYAKVKLIKDKKTEDLFALKVYRRSQLTDELRKQNLSLEISLLASLKHPGIVSFIKAVEAKNHIYIIMEFVSKVSLYDFIDAQGGRLSEYIAKRIFYQLVQAVNYLHSKSIVHRDLKIQNILLQSINSVKLIDFGFACEDQKLKIFCGTPSYMAPEIVERQPYKGKPADIWALGVILYKMLTGLFPFKASSENELYKKISKLQYNTSIINNKLGADLLKEIFVIDPAKRLTATDILNHKWFFDEKSTEISELCDISKNI